LVSYPYYAKYQVPGNQTSTSRIWYTRGEVPAWFRGCSRWTMSVTTIERQRLHDDDCTTIPPGMHKRLGEWEDILAQRANPARHLFIASRQECEWRKMPGSSAWTGRRNLAGRDTSAWWKRWMSDWPAVGGHARLPRHLELGGDHGLWLWVSVAIGTCNGSSIRSARMRNLGSCCSRWNKWPSGARDTRTRWRDHGPACKIWWATPTLRHISGLSSVSVCMKPCSSTGR